MTSISGVLESLVYSHYMSYKYIVSCISFYPLAVPVLADLETNWNGLFSLFGLPHAGLVKGNIIYLNLVFISSTISRLLYIDCDYESF